MRRVIVSEKTLEVNVCSDLLGRIRLLRGCKRAFWMGMKQKQEAMNGIDELILNVPAGVHLALQFKAPRPTPPDGHPFYFTINERQHGHLHRLAMTRPRAVHYVFPHYNTFTSMRKVSPGLLTQTYFLSVADVGRLAPASNKYGRHTVESFPPTAVIHSDPMELELEPAARVVEGILADGPTDALLDHEKLRDWLLGLFEEEQHNPWAIGQRLRGFCTVCIG